MQRTIEDMWSKYIKANQSDWDEILPFILKTRGDQNDPKSHVFGRETDLPIELLYPAPPLESASSNDEYVKDLQHKMKIVHDMAKNTLLEAGQRQKLVYDRRVSKHNYQVGDAV